MTNERQELARRAYAALNAAFKSGDGTDLLRFVHDTYEPEIVLASGGAALPEVGEWRGYEGIVRFVEGQMEAFSEMWIEPYEFTDLGDQLLVLCRFGGRARATGIAIEFTAAHLFTFRADKVVRQDLYPGRDQALAAAGQSKEENRA